MAAFSTTRTSNAQTAHVSWKFKLLDGESFWPSPDINYVRASTKQAVKQKINSILGKLPVLYGQNVLGQFWGAIGDRNTFLLTTTCQPAVVYGNNQELESYHKACLKRKLYVHVFANPQDIPVAVGLPGRIFVKCRPEWSKNIHDYPGDQQPLGQDAYFNKDWGSFGVPLFVDDQCIGALQFITDKLKDSYDDDIDIVCRALEDAGLQTSTQIEHPQMTTGVVCREGIRKTKSSAFTNYHLIAQLLGLSKRDAAAKLGLTEGTFANVRRSVGIPEWLCLPNATWTASSPHENQTNQTALSEEDIFGSLTDICDLMKDGSDLTDQGNYEASGIDQVTDMADALNATWTASSSHENQINQTLSEEDIFGSLLDTCDLMADEGNYEASGTDQDTDMANALNATWRASSPHGTRINQTSLREEDIFGGLHDIGGFMGDLIDQGNYDLIWQCNFSEVSY